MISYETISTSSHEDWLHKRRLGIGASEMAAVLGLSRWTSPLALYAEKIGAAPPADLSDVEQVEWGLELEGVICSVYGRRTGRGATRSGELLRSLEYPWALATLDAWTSIDGVRVPLEIKTAGAHKAEEWAEGPPVEYVVQVQHQMLVTGAPKASVACLLGGQRLVWCDVERDESVIARIVDVGSRFWQCVQERIPPGVDGTEHTRRALAALYPSDDGQTISLGGDLLDVDDELVALKGERSRIDEKIAHAEARLKSAIATAARGVLPNGVAYTWKTSERAGYTVAPTKTRTLRRTEAKGKAA